MTIDPSPLTVTNNAPFGAVTGRERVPETSFADASRMVSLLKRDNGMSQAAPIRAWSRSLPVAALLMLFVLSALFVMQLVDGLQAQSLHAPVGVADGDPLQKVGLAIQDLEPSRPGQRVRYRGMSRYLNNARAVVTGTIDDSSRFVPVSVDALDKYGIKISIAVSTLRDPIDELWPRLQAAVENGHEIASHSRRHQCQWPDTESFCRATYSEDELQGSRNDILANTDQPYVWSWVYPCGNCSGYEFVHQRLAEAGFLVARNYPDEKQGGHLLPDLQTWAIDPYNAAYTQVVQKIGGIAPAGRTDVRALNAKFDEVYENGGIYHFMSHPQWIDYGEETFFEKHLAHLGPRKDVWYVPMGPLYAYQTLAERTVVSRLAPRGEAVRFVVYNDLDPRIYGGSVTLEFQVAGDAGVRVVSSGKQLSERSGEEMTDRWDEEYFRREGDRVFVTVGTNKVVELTVK